MTLVSAVRQFMRDKGGLRHGEVDVPMSEMMEFWKSCSPEERKSYRETLVAQGYKIDD